MFFPSITLTWTFTDLFLGLYSKSSELCHLYGEISIPDGSSTSQVCVEVKKEKTSVRLGGTSHREKIDMSSPTPPVPTTEIFVYVYHSLLDLGYT